jgi:nicotinamidase-related amidase
MILRAGGIDTLVLFGIATSGLVLSTLLEASDNDYGIVVIADCCADLDTDLHTCLMGRLFPRRADVMTADEFAQAMKRRSHELITVSPTSAMSPSRPTRR